MITPKKLEEMRLTVDEKLQKSVEERFNNSFKQISGQLTQVYQGLGEMKNRPWRRRFEEGHGGREDAGDLWRSPA